MAAVDPLGSEKYWFQGLPFEGLNKENEGTEKYWYQGLPGDDIFPTGPGPGGAPAGASMASKLVAAGVL